LRKPRLLAANKMDEPVAEANLKKFKRKAGKIRIIPMAAGFDQGIDQFKKVIRQTVEDAGES
jgi:GTPase